MTPYFGLYPAYVVQNDERVANPPAPRLGRVRVAVPDVYGDITDQEKLPWARICVPAFGGGLYSTERKVIDTKEKGPSNGSGLLAIPPIGTTGYVMFEQGDPQWPVWLGSWYGTEKELPTTMMADTVQKVEYPNIFVIGTPWGKDMFIRFSGDRQIEVAVGDYMAVQLIAESKKDAGDNKIKLSAKRGNVEISALTGDLIIGAKNIVMMATNDVTVYAGLYKKETDGSVSVDTVGSLTLQSTKNTMVSAEKVTTIQASAKDIGEIQGRAANASGFDQHRMVQA